MATSKSKRTNRRNAREQAPATVAPPAVANAAIELEEVRGLKHFFKPEDWWAAAATFLFSALLFFRHMAPEVTLQDSGELVTGAFNFGVPHPPGYPLWALLGFIWSHFIVPFGNPAWRIGTMSVVTGGLVVGVMTLVMTRSTRVMLHALPWSDGIDERLQHWIALMVGISTALLFGFNRGVWLWACVSEMRVLNVFSFVLMGCTFFGWMIEPRRKGFLYATLLIFGLSMTNHQTVSVMAGALVVGTLAEGLDQFFYARRRRAPGGLAANAGLLMLSLKTFWELTIAVLFSAAAGFLLFAWLRMPSNGASITLQPDFDKTIVLCLAGVVLLIAGRLCGWVKLRQALKYTGFFLAGCAFYLYMPIASQTNPPMNWGYAGTKEGFLHAVTRGQYEKLQMADLFNPEFLTKIKVFVLGLCHQYSWPLCAFGLLTIIVAAVWMARELRKRRWILLVWAVSFVAMLVGLTILRVLAKQPVASAWPALYWAAALSTILCGLIALWLYLRWPGGSWMIFVWTAFFVTSLGLLTIINPKLDRQEQEITIKFFAPAHGFYAMLIGYGIAMTIGYGLRLWKTVPHLLVRCCCVGLLALPVITYRTNWSLCALETHDFGYQFGYRMFCPGGGYPDMERNAVLYGGTDPGRFVPTYMIFCESRVLPKHRYRDPALGNDNSFDRSDVYIITQNALADNTYMSYIRDHYDISRPTNNATMLQRWLGRDHTYPVQPIIIPNADDSARAFQQFVDGVQSGRIPAGADLKVENGRVSVTGVQGVMAINGILAKWIFEKNKDKHAFYVEESYVIPWMYPYLRPAGVIMKIEKEPIPSPQENPALWKDLVARDKAYWDALTTEFNNREEFCRNNDAKKSFSKMRSAIAGLYISRGMIPEAEYALRQSLSLCPESPEGCFRLAELYMQGRRFEDARQLIEEYQRIDPYNGNVASFLNQIKETGKNESRRVELEKVMEKGADLNTVMELIAVYGRMNMQGPFAALAMRLLDTTNMPPQAYLQAAQICSDARRPDLTVEALKRYLRLDPLNPRVWIELGLTQMAGNQAGDAIASLKKAVEVGGEPARDLLRNDVRFDRIRPSPQFQALIQQAAFMPSGDPWSKGSRRGP
ncbi:MAG: DUF2723 domain-containing protein [bacterium]